MEAGAFKAMRRMETPGLEDAAGFVSRRARPGDLVLTVGAGDVDRAAPLILTRLEGSRRG